MAGLVDLYRYTCDTATLRQLLSPTYATTISRLTALKEPGTSPGHCFADQSCSSYRLWASQTPFPLFSFSTVILHASRATTYGVPIPVTQYTHREYNRRYRGITFVAFSRIWRSIGSSVPPTDITCFKPPTSPNSSPDFYVPVLTFRAFNPDKPLPSSISHYVSIVQDFICCDSPIQRTPTTFTVTGRHAYSISKIPVG